MSEHELLQARRSASAVMTLLARMTVPPIPLFYKLFYDYVVGVPDPASDISGSKLRQHLKSGAPMSEQQYEEFARPYREREIAATKAADSMLRRLDVLNELIGDADEASRAHSMSLDEASGYLEQGDLRAGLIKDLVFRLIATHSVVIKANHALTQELEAAKTELDTAGAALGELIESSRIDPITGVINRVGVDQELHSAIAGAGPEHPLALAMIDIDHFKRFNDTHGHQAGDAVLRLLGRALLASSRSGQIVGRFGGDEFVAVLPDTSGEEAMVVAERIRRAVLESDLGKHISKEILGNVTASIGVACLRDGDDLASLLARADSALYEAKRLGRNRVVHEQDVPIAA